MHATTAKAAALAQIVDLTSFMCVAPYRTQATGPTFSIWSSGWPS